MEAQKCIRWFKYIHDCIQVVVFVPNACVGVVVNLMEEWVFILFNLLFSSQNKFMKKGPSYMLLRQEYKLLCFTIIFSFSGQLKSPHQLLCKCIVPERTMEPRQEHCFQPTSGKKYSKFPQKGDAFKVPFPILNAGI